MGFTGQNQDALTTRQACIALTQLSALPDQPTHQAMQPVYKSLVWMLLSDSLPDGTWYTAAEAAVTAVYALHPAPQELARVIVQRLGKLALHRGSTSSQAESGGAWPLSTCHQVGYGSWMLASVCATKGKAIICVAVMLSSQPIACLH